MLTQIRRKKYALISHTLRKHRKRATRQAILWSPQVKESVEGQITPGEGQLNKNYDRQDKNGVSF